MARRSARLASLTKAPKPATESPPLSSVAEHDDSPTKAAPAPAPEPEPKPVGNSRDPVPSSPALGPKTPGGSSPIKPPMSEMHPSKVRPTMGPPSSGLRLGFTDIKPTTSRDGNGIIAATQTTPSRVTVPSSPFTFRMTRDTPNSDMGLGPEAQRMMEQLRGDAAKIREELRAKRDAEQADANAGLDGVGGRKIALAKGKASRFSAAHMAEFKKMDSIANHPSAFRAQQGRTTPLKAGVKRSNADLDEVDEVASSKAPTPARSATIKEPSTTAKRARQKVDDDASSKGPTSRDGSSIPAPRSGGLGIPRSKSNLASTMTPTKSSLARTTSVKSPSKATPSGIPRSATTNSLPISHPATDKEPEAEAEAKTPASRFDRVKAMLRNTKASTTKPKSALPVPSAVTSQTPAPARQERPTFTAPMTTPGRKAIKRVAFTPDTTQRTVLAQNSPSPIKSILRVGGSQPQREIHYPSLEGVLAETTGSTATTDSDGVSYPNLSARRPLPQPPLQPELSTPFSSAKTTSAKPAFPVSGPGDFTFRSDHTISFNTTATRSFGSSPGQTSVRAVRPSIVPPSVETDVSVSSMPGSFPPSATESLSDSATPGSGASGAGSNKENETPTLPRPGSTSVKKTGTSYTNDNNNTGVFRALPHGMSTKKRHRVSTDEEEAEQEAAERAAKKRRAENLPEGDALLAPRLVAAGKTSTINGGIPNASVRRGAFTSPRKLAVPGRVGPAPGTPSPMKRKGISLSRLNMLARPKMRK
ncbi:uncharacterized protein C8A04DRAFT_28459 [Dichotomopilus funicola]|uniref:Uncharacterized protein n=1 Tax=Dichotomopilus funicola TaxID=1934379 RepID=A0AAN6ZMZ6_9PEZI|nr:hypothetical protein C8A04DRAFT_28459 [Dichotomopilus funicola]